MIPSSLSHISRDFCRDLHSLSAHLLRQTRAQLPSTPNHLFIALHSFIPSMDTVPSSLFPKALPTQGCYV